MQNIKSGVPCLHLLQRPTLQANFSLLLRDVLYFMKAKSKHAAVQSNLQWRVDDVIITSWLIRATQ